MNVLQLLLKPKWQSRLQTGIVDIGVLNSKALGCNCILLQFVFDYSWTFPWGICQARGDGFHLFMAKGKLEGEGHTLFV